MSLLEQLVADIKAVEDHWGAADPQLAEVLALIDAYEKR